MVDLSSFFSSPYTLLPSSQDVQGFKTRARAAPRPFVYFVAAQLFLVVLLFSFFRPGPPTDHDLRLHEWAGFEDVCNGGEFGRYACETYGPHNVKLSRTYEGTGTRFREVFRRIQQDNAPLRVAVLGGSVTRGHGVGNLGSGDIWAQRTFNELSKSHPHPDNSFTNAAVPAVGSRFFAACLENSIRRNEVDIVFLEHGINDNFDHDAALSMEDLIRSLLDLPQRPAVLLARPLGLAADMISNGGDEHLSVAAYYDTPVLSLRPVLLPLLVKAEGERDQEFFVKDGWGWPDRRHINPTSHHALADFVSSYVLDQFTIAQRQLDLLRRTGKKDWERTFMRKKKHPSAVDIEWPGPEAMGNVPKLRLFHKYEPTTIVAPLTSQCFTMEQGDLVTNHLLPSLAKNDGWSQLTPGNTPDKTYLWASKPGSSFSVELDVTGGKVEIYYLRAGDAAYALGSVLCWVDEVAQEKKTRFDGWWWEGMPHVGQFGIVAENLSRGKHTLTCELMKDTANPHGGTEFRVISVVAL